MVRSVRSARLEPWAATPMLVTPGSQRTKGLRLLQPSICGDQAMAEDKEKDWRASLPFPAHWLGYIAIKLVVLALVTLFALHYYGLL
jgi:hypothetical protein